MVRPSRLSSATLRICQQAEETDRRQQASAWFWNRYREIHTGTGSGPRRNSLHRLAPDDVVAHIDNAVVVAVGGQTRSCHSVRLLPGDVIGRVYIAVAVVIARHVEQMFDDPHEIQKTAAPHRPV